MSDEPKYNSFTATDIERYYNGQMSAAERHALEKAALDDPFLADALEGYTFTATPVADVNVIKERLQEKVSKRRVIPFMAGNYKWLQIAALFLVLGGAGWYLYNYGFKSKREMALSKPAQQKQKETDTNNSLLDSTKLLTTETRKPTKETSPLQNTVSSGEDKSLAFKTKTSKEPEVNNVAAAPAINQSAPLTSNDATSKEVNENRNLAKGTIANSNKDLSYNAAPSESRKDSRSSAEANVIKPMADTTLGLVAAHGRLQGKTSGDTVNINVVMQPSKEEMNEVVVVGLGAKKRALPAPAAKFEELEPAEGWNNFNDYIVQNLKEPEEIKEKKVSGDVELSFDVNKEGEAVNIKVEKSLCSTCDEEAIRLLKEGPKWKKKKAKKGKIAIRF